MKVYQEVLNALTAETQGILDLAGYNPNSLVLTVSLWPGEGWRYEALAAKADKTMREKLVPGDKAATAEQFLTVLRERVGISELEPA